MANYDVDTRTYLVQKNVLFFIFGTLCSYDLLPVIGGNEARPPYLQLSICDASWSTGARILSSVVGAPQQKRQQQQHILESRLTCFFLIVVPWSYPELF